ncbi:MAG: hypothetical protein EBU90_02995 [Proteobacteria bacterium]|jgi:hypothetical protein|nr:hypothetical protein [Pseudomonadota bacterium]
MKTFQQFVNEAYQKLDERYKPLPVGRMDRRAIRTAATGVGHLGVAGAAIGAENAVGEIGDLPDEIARRSVERSVRPLERSSKIIKTRLTHSPERSQEREKINKQKANKVNEDLRQLQKDLDTLEYKAGPRQRLAARKQAARQRSRTSAADFRERSLQRAASMKARQQQMRKDYLHRTGQAN